MATFSYAAVDSMGKRITGVLEAPNRDVVVNTLQERDLIITKISEGPVQPAKEKLTAAKINIIPPKIKSEDLMVFTRELATMIGAGLPLVECLYSLAEDIDNDTMKKTIQDLGAKLIAGVSFSDALKAHPKVFDRMYINLIKVGEMSGNLDQILLRLADYIEASESLKRKIFSALYYPITILTFGFLIVSALFLFVIPRFAEIFTAFGSDLPGPTKLFLAFSTFVQKWFFLLALAIILLVYAFNRFVRTDVGRERFDALKLTMPVFGSLVRKIVIARFSRTLALLYSSGVPIIEALDLVASASGNMTVEKALKLAGEQVLEGARITGTLEKSKIFPHMVIHMIDVGERTGSLSEMLVKVSEFYDMQVNAAINGLTTLIEPILIVCMGILIGATAICLFLPIVKLPTIVNQ